MDTAVALVQASSSRRTVRTASGASLHDDRKVALFSGCTVTSTSR